MPGEPTIQSVSRQITGLDRRVTDLERARQLDRTDRKESQDRIEAALAAIVDPKDPASITYKVNGLMDIVVQFRGIGHLLRASLSVVTAMAGLAALVTVVHAVWP